LVLCPAAVDAAAAGGPVGLRQLQAFVAEQREEARLEVAQGDLDVAVEDRAELLRAGGGRAAGEDGVDLPRGGAVADACLVAGPGELAAGELRGEGDEG
jgi:hypothetical protein